MLPYYLGCYAEVDGVEQGAGEEATHSTFLKPVISMVKCGAKYTYYRDQMV